MMPRTRIVRKMMRAMCFAACLGSALPMRALQQGQRWVNFLKPGRHLTRKEASQEPKRQQVMQNTNLRKRPRWSNPSQSK